MDKVKEVPIEKRSKNKITLNYARKTQVQAKLSGRRWTIEVW